MSAQHTEAPWAYAKCDSDTGIATVCIVGDFVVGPDHGSPGMASYDNHGTDEADARLIAAAPELLAALEEARDGLRWYQDRNPGQTDSSDDEAMARIAAAIARATGEAP